MSHKYTTAPGKRREAYCTSQIWFTLSTRAPLLRALRLVRRGAGVVRGRLRSRLLAPVGGARVAPKAILDRRCSLDVPGIGFDHQDGAANVEYDATDLAVASNRPRPSTGRDSWRHRCSRLQSLVVSFPTHKSVLPELALLVTGTVRLEVAKAANCAVLHVSGHLVGRSLKPGALVRSSGQK